MTQLTEYADAKINLTLGITGSLPGGYHELTTIMQSVSLRDELTISVCDGNGKIEVNTDRGFLPKNENNLAGLAARAILNAAGVTGKDISIEIKKHIPVGAGLGGGSADAAAVLRGVNRLMSLGFDRYKLEEIGAVIGSDVPFCVRGGTVLAGGRGEVMQDVPSLPLCTIVLCKPNFSVSTAALFSKYDRFNIKCLPDTAGILDALKKASLPGIAHRLYNVFEEIPSMGTVESGKIKTVMYDCGALGAAMSGSGPTVYGIFAPGDPGAETALAELKKDYCECALCSPTAQAKI